MLYKEKGADAGFASRYFEPGVGRYTFLTCGGCHHTAQPANVVEAKVKGWRRRPDWGWLCAVCLVRLKLHLTPTQQLAVERAPAGWFSCEDIRQQGVRCALMVCRQLVKLGEFEERSCCPPGEDFLSWIGGTPLQMAYDYRRKLPTAE